MGLRDRVGGDVGTGIYFSQGNKSGLWWVQGSILVQRTNNVCDRSGKGQSPIYSIQMFEIKIKLMKIFPYHRNQSSIFFLYNISKSRCLRIQTSFVGFEFLK